MEKPVLDEYEIQLILDAVDELKKSGTINIPKETTIQDIVEGLVRNQIQAFLEREYAKKNIYYGMHVSDRALLTCLLHVDSKREVHFVDAADGGYALAARQMKKQMQDSP